MNCTQNQSIYNLADVAAGYAERSSLQPPEVTILRLMLPHLPTADMLDLGVGGGRTTIHFAKLARSYVGADYSETMVKECRKRFSGWPASIDFKVCDARSMDIFASRSFDFVLFSHNGLDYVSHEDRLQILREVRRVGRPGGWFCFSTHNLNFGANLFELRRTISLQPARILQSLKRLGLRYIYNWKISAKEVRKASHFTFNDGAHHRRLVTYYIRPEAQIAQLNEHFSNVRAFSLSTGEEIISPTKLRSNDDAWLYYLCNFRS